MVNSLMKGFLFFGLLMLGMIIPAVQAEGDPSAGVEVYILNCAPCHGDNMEGNIGPALKDNSFVADSDETALIQAIADGREENGMPAFKDQLSEQEIQDAVALMKNPSALASRSSSGLKIKEPEIDIGDILPGLKNSFLFVYAWAMVATVALMVWIKHKGEL
jgi:cytochrome c553